MHLTSDQVRKVAKLANLPIKDEELDKYSKQLSKILEYIDQLSNIDTSNVEPTFNVSGQNNVMIEDEVSTSLAQEETLQNAPQERNGFFVTKGVFEE